MRVRLLPTLLTALAVFGAGAGDLNQRPLWPSTVQGSMLVDALTPWQVTRGLVGWWDFVEGSGTTTRDMSGNGNTATLRNADAEDWVVFGSRGTGFDLDGTAEWGEVSDSSAFSIGTGDFSACFEFATDATGSWVGLIDHMDVADCVLSPSPPCYSGREGYQCQIMNTDKIRCRVDDGTNYVLVDSNTTISTGTLYKTCLVVDRDSSTGARLWINGTAESSTYNPTAVTGSLDAEMNLRIGNAGGLSIPDNDVPLNGRMANVRIYNLTLTAAEIAAVAAGD